MARRAFRGQYAWRKTRCPLVLVAARPFAVVAVRPLAEAVVRPRMRYRGFAAGTGGFQLLRPLRAKKAFRGCFRGFSTSVEVENPFLLPAEVENPSKPPSQK